MSRLLPYNHAVIEAGVATLAGAPEGGRPVEPSRNFFPCQSSLRHPVVPGGNDVIFALVGQRLVNLAGHQDNVQQLRVAAVFVSPFFL